VPVPRNITLRRWVPQVEVLSRTALIITHGGVSTIKETVLHVVPMVACPVGRNQFVGATLLYSPTDF
jgi:zeaxanthin glucosyltransferase